MCYVLHYTPHRFTWLRYSFHHICVLKTSDQLIIHMAQAPTHPPEYLLTCSLFTSGITLFHIILYAWMVSMLCFVAKISRYCVCLSLSLMLITHFYRLFITHLLHTLVIIILGIYSTLHK